LLEARFAHLSYLPIRGEVEAWLYLKVIVSGAMHVEG